MQLAIPALLMAMTSTAHGQVRVPEGTRIHARLAQNVSQAAADRAPSLTLWVTEPVTVGSTTVIGTGATAEAKVQAGAAPQWSPARVQAVDGTWITVQPGVRERGGSAPSTVWDGYLATSESSEPIPGDSGKSEREDALEIWVNETVASMLDFLLLVTMGLAVVAVVQATVEGRRGYRKFRMCERIASASPGGRTRTWRN